MKNLIETLSSSWFDYRTQMSKAHPSAVLSKFRFIKHGFLNAHVYNDESGVVLYQKFSLLGVECVVPSHFAPKSFKDQKRLIESFGSSNQNNVVLAVTPQLSKMAKRMGYIILFSVKAYFAGKEIEKEILVHKSLLTNILITLSGAGLLNAISVLLEISRDFQEALAGGYVNSEYIVSRPKSASNKKAEFFFERFQPYFFGEIDDLDISPEIFNLVQESEDSLIESFDSIELEDSYRRLDNSLQYEELYGNEPF